MGPAEQAGCALAPLVCGAQDAAGDIADKTTGIRDAVSDVADFWSDPAGNTFNMLQDGARGLAETILPAITKATLPDLTLDWFLKSYAISFGMAIFVMVALLIPQFVRTARGTQSGRDTAEAVGIYAPLFLAFAAFGPAIGIFLVKFFGALTDSLVGWGINATTETIIDRFTALLSEKDNGESLAGGAVVGVVLMVGMLAGLLLVMLVLIVQLVTLYFSGVLFPLGLVWIVDPSKRKFGTKIAYLWFGVLASHPLLFFLLTVAYFMVGANITAFSDNATLQQTVDLVVSLLALLMAGLSPLLLLKFAPVIPTGGMGTAPAGATLGSSSMKQADDRVSQQGPSGGDDGGSGNSSSNIGTSTARSDSGQPPAETNEPTSSVTAAARNTGAGAGEGSTLGAMTATAGAGTTAGAGAAEGTAAAGAAETSTGVGAVVGIPTLLATGAGKAADVSKKANAAVGQTATNPVDDHEQHYGKDSTS